MRKLIDTIILLEKTMSLSLEYDRELTVLVNPTASNLLSYVKNADYNTVRGGVFMGKWYFWNGFEALHYDVAESLSMLNYGDDSHHFDIVTVVTNSLKKIRDQDDWAGQPYGYFQKDEFVFSLRIRDVETPEVKKLFPEKKLLKRFKS